MAGVRNRVSLTNLGTFATIMSETRFLGCWLLALSVVEVLVACTERSRSVGCSLFDSPYISLFSQEVIKKIRNVELN